MKLTPGVNFTNVLPKAFTRADHNITKKTVKSLVLYVLLESARKEAAYKTLVKSTLKVVWAQQSYCRVAVVIPFFLFELA